MCCSTKLALVAFGAFALTVVAPRAGAHPETPGHPHTHDHAHPDTDADDYAAESGRAHALLHPSHDPDAPCACDHARAADGWCRSCNVGYIAGVLIESKLLYSTADPHGHELNLSAFNCKQCRHAIQNNAYCDTCGLGFVRGMAYYTRLTHALAQGRQTDPRSIRCDACTAHLDQPGWCDPCSRGMVGQTAIFNKAIFQRAADEREILIAATEKTAECEVCACAMIAHRQCPLPHDDPPASGEDGPPTSMQDQRPPQTSTVGEEESKEKSHDTQ